MFNKEPFEIDIEDGQIIYYEQFFDLEQSDIYFTKLHQETDWKEDKITMFGKEIPLPRLTAWYGDPGASYLYSGINNDPSRWTETLTEIKKQVEAVSDNSYNSLLMNLYRSGRDKLSWHADDEPELDRQCSIASVTFGSARDFCIKHKRKEGLRHTIPLKHGSLLIMKPPMQEHWLHQIPLRKNVEEERINLTFRYVTN